MVTAWPGGHGIECIRMTHEKQNLSKPALRAPLRCLHLVTGLVLGAESQSTAWIGARGTSGSFPRSALARLRVRAGPLHPRRTGPSKRPGVAAALRTLRAPEVATLAPRAKRSIHAGIRPTPKASVNALANVQQLRWSQSYSSPGQSSRRSPMMSATSPSERGVHSRGTVQRKAMPSVDPW